MFDGDASATDASERGPKQTPVLKRASAEGGIAVAQAERLAAGDYRRLAPRALTMVIDVVACVAFLIVTSVPLLAMALP